MNEVIWENLSIIIPVVPDESAHWNLLRDLNELDRPFEIVLVFSSENQEIENRKQFENKAMVIRERVKLTHTLASRATQLNWGVAFSKRKFLWFLHSDTRLGKDVLALQTSLTRNPDALHFFKLKFQNDGPQAMRINQFGVWIRAQILKMPFGDQGLAISRDNFQLLGKFKENVIYGEDHLLVWAAHQNAFAVLCVNASITTSARKYKTRGWGHTTLRTMQLTWLQATPEIIKLVKIRGKKFFAIKGSLL